MARIDQKLTPEKLQEIESFLISRFEALEDLREEIDNDMKDEIKAYNNDDELIDAKQPWEEKLKIPYVYTLVQTAIARVMKALFPYKNYVKIYVENPKYMDVQRELQLWVQEELDKINFSSRSRDFIEESAVKRVSWLQLRPVPISRNLPDGKKIQGYATEFDILDWYNVWFDTMARTVNDTDFFVRKRKKLWEIKTRPDIYFNLDKVFPRTKSDIRDDEEEDEYRAKHSSTDSSNNNTTVDYNLEQQHYRMTDEVDLYEYYGIYDFSGNCVCEPSWEPGIKEVICTLANKRTLIRVEINDLPTKRKRLFFPIRVLRQSNSLIGKSFPQLTKSLQHNLNEIRSVQLDNFKLNTKLLFKYKRDSGVDLEELYAGAGNAIGFDEDPRDIDLFSTPNLVGLASNMAQQVMADMQAITGAVDTIIGTSSGSGTPETARGTSIVAEQALFRFGMMTENVYDDVLDFINYLVILQIIYNRDIILLNHPKLADFLNVSIEDLEDNYIVDIELKDLSTRREQEMKQWTTLASFLAQALPSVGGNMRMFVKELMEQFDMRNIDAMLEPEDPQQFISKLLANPALLQQVMQIIAQQQSAQAQATPPPGA